MSRLFAFFGDLSFNRPTARRKLTELMVALQASGQALSRRFGSLPDSEGNRRVLSHIIGIERWGQRRLRVALGEAVVHDEYDAYRPARDADWEALRKAFGDARQETIRLIGSIERAGRADTIVQHNQYGALTVRGWLRYLDLHARLEAKKMRG